MRLFLFSFFENVGVAGMFFHLAVEKNKKKREQGANYKKFEKK